MIGKVITNLYKWHITKQQLKQRDKKIDNELVAKKDMIMKLRGLYEFAHWLNTKGIVGNRKQRKIFWNAVQEGKPVIEDVLKQLINKNLERIRQLQGVKNPKPAVKITEPTVKKLDSSTPPQGDINNSESKETNK